MTLAPTPAPTWAPVRAPVPTRRRPAPVSRRLGYLAGATVNAALLYAINVEPGWEHLTFLTPDIDLVLPAVDVAIVAAVLVHLVYVVHDPRWLRGLGDMVTTALALAALAQLWTVFPFSFAGTDVDWETITRFLLAFAIVGTAIGFAAGLVTVTRNLAKD